MTRTALIAGVTGIVGNNLARALLEVGWQVIGLARRGGDLPGETRFVAGDLLDPQSLSFALQGSKPTHVFLTSWLRQATEAENIRVNGAMVRNLLEAVEPLGSVEHVGLVTGLKHYLGPFESYGQGTLPSTPFREEQARLPVENFYYAQEDEVFAAAARQGFTWSVQRPHTIIGYAVGNAMNMGVTLAVYATICRETGKPFVFPGSAIQWSCLTDMTDAGLLGRHLLWSSVTPAAHNQAFNVVNGDVFRWKWMWERLGEFFGLEAAPFPARVTPIEEQLAGADEVWRKIAAKYGLAEGELSRLVSPWHTDADLGRPIEVVTDMSKSRRLGFGDYMATDESFFRLFARLREARIIP